MIFFFLQNLGEYFKNHRQIFGLFVLISSFLFFSFCFVLVVLFCFVFVLFFCKRMISNLKILVLPKGFCLHLISKSVRKWLRSVNRQLLKPQNLHFLMQNNMDFFFKRCAVNFWNNPLHWASQPSVAGDIICRCTLMYNMDALPFNRTEFSVVLLLLFFQLFSNLQYEMSCEFLG